MQIETFLLGGLQTNCFLLHSGGEAVVVDPADDGIFLSEEVHSRNLKLKAIIATHGHFDHVLGAGELQMILPAPFYVHEKDEFLLKEINKSAKFWLKREFKNPPPSEIKFFKEGDEIKFGECSLNVVETPGHTPGAVSLIVKCGKGAPVLLSGDTLFRKGIGRYDFSYSSKDQLKQSIKKIFARLSWETVVYPGHGEETKIEEEGSFLDWAKK